MRGQEEGFRYWTRVLFDGCAIEKGRYFGERCVRVSVVVSICRLVVAYAVPASSIHCSLVVATFNPVAHSQQPTVAQFMVLTFVA